MPPVLCPSGYALSGAGGTPSWPLYFPDGKYTGYACQLVSPGKICPAATPAFSLDAGGLTCSRPGDSPKTLGTCGPCQQTAQTNPINSGTGNKYQSELDYVGSGADALRLERFYNNNSVVAFAQLGAQWRHSYDRAVIFGNIINTATVYRPDGKAYYFSQSSGGATWTSDADVSGKLTRLFDAIGYPAGWYYINEQDEDETYDADGRLTRITSRSGLTQTLTYSCMPVSTICPVATPATVAPAAGLLITVTDFAGRSLRFNYDSTSRVSKMTDPNGGIYTYAYSGLLATDNLTAVTYPDGTVRTYLYGEAANVSPTPVAGVSYIHALTGIVDENGARYASWTYDAQGRAISSEHGAFGSGIDHVGLAYGVPDASGNSVTTVTDPRGNVRGYNFSALLGVVKNTGIVGQPCNGCSAVLGYDANGNVSSSTDFKGNLTTYTYDLARNLETSRTEGLTAAGAKTPATRTTLTTWHSTYRLPLSITEQGASGVSPVTLRSTTFSYDALGNLITKTITDAQTPTATRTLVYTYDALGHLITADGPRTDVADITRYAYDVQGNLTSVTNPLNQITTLGGYDANGRPGTVTDPNGLVTTLNYDLRGRLTKRNAAGETATYTYDLVGNLKGITLPSGTAYSYTYDAAHRLTGIADSLGNRISYTLDLMGNRTKEQTLDAAGNIIQTHGRVFDALNRLQNDIGAINQTTTYTYDPNGNLTGISDPLNRHTANTYDALNRLITSIDPANGRTDYGYNALDQLTAVLDPRGLGTQYNRDGLNNLKQTVSPDTGTTNATYDAAGNVLTRADAKGQIANYTYDALNRITAISYAGVPAQNTSYQYDTGIYGIGHLTGVTDTTGAVAYSYDVHGRLISEVAQRYGATYTTGYTYDAQGRLNSITYPSGRTVNYTFDTQGRIKQIATDFNGTTNVLISNITYQPFGGIQSYTYGDGLTAPVQTYTRQYDKDGRIASYTLNGKSKSVGYDAASQITSISDPLNLANTANYNYDPLSRLTGFTLGAVSQSYGYDADGNRTSKTLGATSSTYSYAAVSNWLTGIQTGAATQTITHDANGATTNDGGRQYSYDARGRLIQSTTAQGIVNYEINAFGLRVRKKAPSSDTLYHYDAQGRLVGESALGATLFTREYVYLGDQPVAVLQ